MKPRYLTRTAAAGALLVFAALPAHAELLSFNSARPADNVATRSAWLAAIGIGAPGYVVDFESGFADGQNLSGVTGVFPADLVITDTGPGTAEAIVRTGNGTIGNSNPVGSFALAHDEGAYLVLDFSAHPVDYLAFQDIDTAGTIARVTFVGGATVNITIDTTGTSGNSAEFFALYRNDQPRIQKVELDASGSPPWGIDNLEYGPAADGLDLQSFTLKSSEVAGCKSVTGTLRLTEPAPAGGVVVTLGDTLAAASTSASVKFLEGATVKTFLVKTVAVDARQSGTVSATLGGTTLSQSLTLRPIGVSSVSLTPTAVVGSQPVAGKATLECKAAPGAIAVDLASSNPAAAQPVAASLSVPQGMQSVSFDVMTAPVLSQTTANISGTAHGITKSKKLTVKVAPSVSPTSLQFGSVTVGTTSAALDASLTNRGAVSFAVNGITLTGTSSKYFEQTNNCPVNLAAGASCTVSVTFKPTATGSKTARLTIATSGTSTALSVTLSGTGVTPR
jgi:hypothetical protein